MEEKFINTQLTPQILINTMIQDKDKYDLVMSKVIGIFSKLIFNNHQSIIKKKTAKEF